MKRRQADRRDGVVKPMDLRCGHCGHVFRFGMERHAQDASFSCPHCGIISRMPSAMSEMVRAEVPQEPSWTTQYQCTACDERMLVHTFGRSHHREVRFRPCPHCKQKHTMRIVSSRGTYAEPVAEADQARAPADAQDADDERIVA